jgi:fucose permease
LLSLGFFIYIGIEVTIQSWIPSYAVLSGIKTKVEAVQFTSIFWITNTIFRFAFGLFKGSNVGKFIILSWAQLLSGGICVLLVMGSHSLSASYLCSILYGISLSQLFPLLISVSSEFNLHITGGQVSNMMIATTVSSGVFSSLTGVLMKLDLDMFFYSMLAFSLIFFTCAKKIVATLREESQLHKE